MLSFNDKRYVRNLVTPSDMLVELVKANLPDDLAFGLSEAIRNARIDAKYEMYKELARAKGHENILTLQEFYEHSNEFGVETLF